MKKDQQRIDNVKKRAMENDRDYVGCSQSVLEALQQEFGIGNEESFMASTVLSGGVVRQGETCGAIIGALSALGLVIGRRKIENTDAYRAMMEPASELRERFIEELQKQFGFEGKLENTLCRSIQEKVYGRSFVMTDPDDYQAFLDAGGHSEIGCPKVCGIAAQVTAEKLMELL